MKKIKDNKLTVKKRQKLLDAALNDQTDTEDATEATTAEGKQRTQVVAVFERLLFQCLQQHSIEIVERGESDKKNGNNLLGDKIFNDSSYVVMLASELEAKVFELLPKQEEYYNKANSIKQQMKDPNVSLSWELLTKKREER